MRSISRITASAALGGLVLLCASAGARAQVAPARSPSIGPVASIAPGSISGTVRDEKGAPLDGAMVSALGATTAFAVTDRSGRFELRTLSPGPYLLRAHLSGFVASRGEIVEVRPSGRSSSAIALHRVAVAGHPELAAGIGGAGQPDTAVAQPAGEVVPIGSDDHSETAWRLRHARRAILKDATAPESVVADAGGGGPETDVFGPVGFLGRTIGSPARVASNFFTGTPFSGQLNLLTTGSFDSPLQLFTTDSFSRSVAYVSVGAPAGSNADWAVRGAITQGDVLSWIVSGSYVTRTPARNRYDIGWTYATQRYDATSPAALRQPPDASRSAGEVYAFDTLALTPAVSLTYGTRYARYDYLRNPGLVSPRVALTFAPLGHHLRVNAIVSRRAEAPGAEEFVPPNDAGIWLPPERTFSSLVTAQPLQAERTTHLALELEQDLPGGSTVSFRAFHQSVADQLVTLFGVRVPDGPDAETGHYFVANSGDVDATGWSAGFRTSIARRVHGSVEYTLTRANWMPGGDLAYVSLVSPSALRLEPERVHDVSTSLETEVPETSTRVIVFYRVSNGFARRDPLDDRPAFDSRFDVQVRQSLPFMNFSNARWEMLLAVRDFFHDVSSDQSMYDELLVVRPPKRVVGGLSLRF